MKKNHKKSYFLVVKSYVIYAFLICLIVLSMASFDTSKDAVKSSMLLCANTIIPSLFPFFVFSKMLIKTGFANLIDKPLSFISWRLFGINGSGAFAFIVGLLSGYPLGASVVCDLYKNQLLDKNDAEKMLAYCNNSGPFFVIGAVGISIFKNYRLGVYLYIVHILSACLVGFLFKFKGSTKNKKDGSFAPKKPSIPISVSISESVEESVFSILNISGFIIVFSVILCVMSPFLDLCVHNLKLKVLFKALFEITLGAKEIYASSLSTFFKASFTSFIIGTGGISVFMQVMGIVKKAGLSINMYALGKLLQGIFSFFMTSFLFKNNYISTFLSADVAEIKFPDLNVGICFFIIFFIYLIIFIKKRKIF